MSTEFCHCTNGFGHTRGIEGCVHSVRVINPEAIGDPNATPVVYLGEEAGKVLGIRQRTEPSCCGEPMVHNTFTGEYECATAYFQIIDDLGDGPGEPFEGIVALLGNDDVPANLVPVLEHWRASRTPDGSAHLSTDRPDQPEG